MKRIDLVYPELSYRIVGILYEVSNELGAGHKEQFYQNALKIAFEKSGIKFKEQVYSPLEYKGEKIGKYFLDFLIDDKIVLEIKKDNIFKQQNIGQVYNYLKVKKLKLGILANFTRNGVKFKRILNIRD